MAFWINGFAWGEITPKEVKEVELFYSVYYVHQAFWPTDRTDHLNKFQVCSVCSQKLKLIEYEIKII